GHYPGTADWQNVAAYFVWRHRPYRVRGQWLQLLRQVNHDEHFRPRHAKFVCLKVERKLSFHARTPKPGKRFFDACGCYRICSVRMFRLCWSMDAMVEPCACRIPFEPVQCPPMSYFDGAKFLDIHRYQQALIAPRLRSFRQAAVMTFHQNNRNQQHRQQQPYGKKLATAWVRLCDVQRRLHHTAMPTTAISAGMRMIDRKNVAFICRLLRSTRGRS